jgi:hypothetical protein
LATYSSEILEETLKSRFSVGHITFWWKLSGKENSATCFQERQRNNKGMRFPSLTKVLSGTMECMCSQHELIIHDLKDKWILDSGVINHMTGHQELVDGITRLIPSISVYFVTPRNLWPLKWVHWSFPKISFQTRGFTYENRGNRLCFSNLFETYLLYS